MRDYARNSIAPLGTHSIRHGSLFSGGGGFDLAAELMGWDNVFTCEIDPFCKRLLQHYWPKAHSFGDIRKFNAKRFKGKIDVLTGGFPCQPFSIAGKRKGTADDRYLWPEMLRVIREIKPQWVVGENVYGILNWNEGLVFEQVHTDLENEGYEVQAFILPASGVNAPHRRYRVWFIAHSITGAKCEKDPAISKKWKKAHREERQDILPEPCGHGTAQHAPNSHIQGLEGSTKARNNGKSWQRRIKQYARLCKRGYWNSWPTQPPICIGDDGLPDQLDGITVSRWRKESIKMYGNAVVPQVVHAIFKAIKETEREYKNIRL